MVRLEGASVPSRNRKDCFQKNMGNFGVQCQSRMALYMGALLKVSSKRKMPESLKRTLAWVTFNTCEEQGKL